MAGREIIRSQCHRFAKQSFKFDKLITFNARVWSASLFVFFDKIRYYFLLEDFAKIESVMRDAEFVGNALCIIGRRYRTATTESFRLIGGFIRWPNIHRYTDYVIARLNKQSGGNRTVDPATHSANYFFIFFVICHDSYPPLNI
jgi:hypothetical protein